MLPVGNLPLIGYALGSQLAGVLSRWAAYLAAILVAGVGVKMLIDAICTHHRQRVAEGDQSRDQGDKIAGDPTRGWSLIALSLATSMDALVVGFSLGIRAGEGIWRASLLIGVIAAAMALAGIVLGRRLGTALGRWAEIAGGAVLIALAATMLWL